MNLLSQLNKIMDTTDESIATVTGQRGDGMVVAQTLGGATIILTGELATGKKCFYDRTTNRILRPAPEVDFAEYGV